MYTPAVDAAPVQQFILGEKGDRDRIRSVSYSPDGKRIVTTDAYGKATIWNAETGNEVLTLSGHAPGQTVETVWNGVTDAAFSPDGSLLASISGSVTEKDNTVRLWQTENWEQIAVMDAHDISWYGDISFSPDETMLVSSGGYWNDNTMRIYDVNKGEQVAVFEGGAKGIVGATFSLDGRLIVSGTFDGSILIWGVE